MLSPWQGAQYPFTLIPVLLIPRQPLLLTLSLDFLVGFYKWTTKYVISRVKVFFLLNIFLKFIHVVAYNHICFFLPNNISCTDNNTLCGHFIVMLLPYIFLVFLTLFPTHIWYLKAGFNFLECHMSFFIFPFVNHFSTHSFCL